MSVVRILKTLFRHEIHEIGHPAGIAPLVVVPRQDLGHVAALDGGVLGVHDARMEVALEIRGDELLFAKGQDAGQRSFGRRLDRGAQFLGGGGLFQLGHEIHQRDGGGGHPHGKAGEFALEFRDDQRHGLGRAGGSGDHVTGRSPGPAQILMGQIQNALVVGVGMHRGHHALDDAEGLVDDLGHRGQTVGGAGGVGQHVMLLGIVLVLVDPEHHGQVLFLGRRGDDDLLGSGLAVRLAFGTGAENTGGFDDHVDGQILPGQPPGIAFGEVLDAPIAHHHDVVFHGGFHGQTAVVGVVTEKVRVGGHVEKVVYGHDFHFIRMALKHGFEYLAANAAEPVDGDAKLGHIWLLLLVESVIVGREQFVIRLEGLMQSGVLDGDGAQVGDGRGEIHFFAVKGAFLVGVDAQHADGTSFHGQRQDHQGGNALFLGRAGILEARIVTRILDLDDLPGEHLLVQAAFGQFHRALPQIALGQTVGRAGKQHFSLPIQQSNGAGLGRQGPGHLLHNGPEHDHGVQARIDTFGHFVKGFVIGTFPFAHGSLRTGSVGKRGAPDYPSPNVATVPGSCRRWMTI